MLANKYSLWTPEQVITVSFENGSYPLQEFVRSQIESITKKTSLRFLWRYSYEGRRSNQGGMIRIDFGRNFPEWEYLIVCAVGTQALEYDRDKPTFRLNAIKTYFNRIRDAKERILFLQRGGTGISDGHYGSGSDQVDKIPQLEKIITYWQGIARAQLKHEAFHMLGIEHEHNHPDSGLPWKLEYSSLKFTHEDTIATAIDRESIMHYPLHNLKGLLASTEGLYDVPFITEPSVTDIETIQAIYPVTGYGPPIPKIWADYDYVSLPENYKNPRDFKEIDIA